MTQEARRVFGEAGTRFLLSVRKATTSSRKSIGRDTGRSMKRTGIVTGPREGVRFVIFMRTDSQRAAEARTSEVGTSERFMMGAIPVPILSKFLMKKES